MNRKWILAILLTLVMLLGMMPAAYAEETDAEETGTITIHLASKDPNDEDLGQFYPSDMDSLAVKLHTYGLNLPDGTYGDVTFNSDMASADLTPGNTLTVSGIPLNANVTLETLPPEGVKIYAETDVLNPDNYNVFYIYISDKTPITYTLVPVRNYYEVTYKAGTNGPQVIDKTYMENASNYYIKSFDNLTWPEGNDTSKTFSGKWLESISGSASVLYDYGKTLTVTDDSHEMLATYTDENIAYAFNSNNAPVSWVLVKAGYDGKANLVVNVPDISEEVLLMKKNDEYGSGIVTTVSPTDGKATFSIEQSEDSAYYYAIAMKDDCAYLVTFYVEVPKITNTLTVTMPDAMLSPVYVTVELTDANGDPIPDCTISDKQIENGIGTYAFNSGATQLTLTGLPNQDVNYKIYVPDTDENYYSQDPENTANDYISGTVNYSGSNTKSTEVTDTINVLRHTGDLTVSVVNEGGNADTEFPITIVAYDNGKYPLEGAYDGLTFYQDDSGTFSSATFNLKGSEEKKITLPTNVTCHVSIGEIENYSYSYALNDETYTPKESTFPYVEVGIKKNSKDTVTFTATHTTETNYLLVRMGSDFYHSWDSDVIPVSVKLTDTQGNVMTGSVDLRQNISDDPAPIPLNDGVATFNMSFNSSVYLSVPVGYGYEVITPAYEGFKFTSASTLSGLMTNNTPFPDVYFDADYIGNLYKITYEASPFHVDYIPTEVRAGTMWTLHKVTNYYPDSYKFLGWTIDGDDPNKRYESGDNVEINKDTQFNAVYSSIGSLKISIPQVYNAVDEFDFTVKVEFVDESGNVQPVNGIFETDSDTIPPIPFTDGVSENFTLRSSLNGTASITIKDLTFYGTSTNQNFRVTLTSAEKEGCAFDSNALSQTIYASPGSTADAGFNTIYVTYTSDITLDYNVADIEPATIEDFEFGTYLSSSDLESYRNYTEQNGKLHRGWFIDENQNGNLDDTETVLADYFGEPNYTLLDKADLQSTKGGNTITAYWEDGCILTYKDDRNSTLTGDEVFSVSYYRLFNEGSAYDTVQSVEGIFNPNANGDYWSQYTNHSFVNWKVEGEESTTYSANDPITLTRSVTLVAVWKENAAPEYEIKLKVHNESTHEESYDLSGAFSVYHPIRFYPELWQNGAPITVADWYVDIYGMDVSDNSFNNEGSEDAPKGFAGYELCGETQGGVDLTFDDLNMLYPNVRTWNVQFVAVLNDDTLVGPSKTFTFSQVEPELWFEYNSNTVSENTLTHTVGDYINLFPNADGTKLYKNIYSPYVTYQAFDSDNGAMFEPIVYELGSWYYDSIDLNSIYNTYSLDESSTLRITLGICTRDESGNLVIYDENNVSNYMVTLDVKFEEPEEYSVQLLAIDENGEDVPWDDETIFSYAQNITFKPVLMYGKEVIEDVTTWQWNVLGNTHDYDNGWTNGENSDIPIESDDFPTLDTSKSDQQVTLQDIMNMDRDETQWSISVSDQSSGYYHSEFFTINVSMYSYVADITDEYTGDEDDYTYDLSNLAADTPVTFKASSNCEDESTSWAWTARSRDSGVEHALSDVTSNSVQLADVLKLDEYTENWTLIAHQKDASDTQITNDASIEFTVPYSGEFFLAIDSSQIPGYFDYVGNYTGDPLKITSMDKPRFHASYMGTFEDKDSYSPHWTMTALNDDGSEISDATYTIYTYSEDDWNITDEWYDGNYFSAEDMHDSIAEEEHREHLKWRIKLALTDDEGHVYTGTDGDTGYQASLDVIIPIKYTVTLKATLDGSDLPYDEEYNTHYTDDVVFTASISPEVKGGVSWWWDIYGYTNDYEAVFKSDSNTLSQKNDLLMRDEYEDEWRIRVYALPADVEEFDDDDDEDLSYGSERVYANIQLYDYTASITAKNAEDITVEEYSFDTNSTGVTFSAKLAPEYSETNFSITWHWRLSGEDTGTNKDFIQDTLKIEDIVAANKEETYWYITAYAEDSTGKRLCENVETEISVAYTGDFYVKIRQGSKDFTGHENNYYLARGWKEYEYYCVGALPEGYTNPHWTIVPLKDKDTPDSGSEYTISWHYVDEYEISYATNANGTTLAEDGYDIYDHKLWKLTLAVANDEGEVYVDSTGRNYTASVIIDNSNPLAVRIMQEDEDYDGEYIEAPSSLSTSLSSKFYQDKYGEDVDGYDVPYWTVLPLNSDLSYISGVNPIRITPDNTLWEDEWDEYYEYIVSNRGGITGQNIYDEIAENYPDLLIYDHWELKLQIANSANAVYNGDSCKSTVKVYFSDWPEEEETAPTYTMAITDSRTGISYDSTQESPTIKASGTETDLTLNAQLLSGNEPVADGVTYNWNITGQITNEGATSTHTFEEITGSECNLNKILETENLTELSIKVSAFNSDDSEPLASMEIDLVLSKDVEILSPTVDENKIVNYGDKIELTTVAINATGYQWYYRTQQDGKPIVLEGETNPTLTIKSAAFDNIGLYFCEVTGNQMTGEGESVDVILNNHTGDADSRVETHVLVQAQITVPETIEIRDDDTATLSITSIYPKMNSGYTYRWETANNVFVNPDGAAQNTPELTISNAVVGAKYHCILLYNGTWIGRSKDIELVDNERDPDPNAPGIRIIVNDTEVTEDTVNDLPVGEEITIKAEATGEIAGYTISAKVGDDPLNADENGTFTYKPTKTGEHKLVVTASPAEAQVLTLRSAPVQDGNNYVATITLKVTDTMTIDPNEPVQPAGPDAPATPVTGGGKTTLDLDPATPDILDNHAINITGIQKNEEPQQYIVYNVEVVWGDMQFKWMKPAATTSVWDPDEHIYVSQDGTAQVAHWELVSADAEPIKGSLGDGSATGDQSTVLVFNHSNKPVNVDVTIEDEGVADITSSLTAETTGAKAATKAETQAITYTLDVHDLSELSAEELAEASIYTTNSTAKVKVSLSEEGVKADELDTTKKPVATITVTLTEVTDVSSN